MAAVSTPRVRSPEYRETVVALWIAGIALYYLGDWSITYVAVQLGGFEANPFARALLDRWGVFGLVVSKIPTTAALCAAWYWWPRVGDLGPDPWRAVIPALVVLHGVFVVGNNLLVIAELI